MLVLVLLAEPILMGVPGKPSVSDMHTPTPSETLNDAMSRYSNAFEVCCKAPTMIKQDHKLISLSFMDSWSSLVMLG